MIDLRFCSYFRIYQYEKKVLFEYEKIMFKFKPIRRYTHLK